MLEIANVLGGASGGAMDVSVTPNATDLAPGSQIEFTVNYTNVPPGLTFYWSFGGDFTPDLVQDAAVSGSFETAGEGTVVIPVQTLLNETLDAAKTITLQVRILSTVGNIVAESAVVTLVYSSHPAGQQQYIIAGVHEFVVPEFVQFISAVCVGAGSASAPGLSTKGGDGGSMRWRNRMAVTPGETLQIEVGKGGLSVISALDQIGGRSCVIRRTDTLITAKGGGGPNLENTERTYVWVNGTAEKDGHWSVPEQPPYVGGGDGGVGGDGGGSGPGGGGGAGGYLGDGGDGANRTAYYRYRGYSSDGYQIQVPGGFPAFEASGGAGGGGNYYISNNNTYHATPGGGVGVVGRGRDGEGGRNNNAVDGGRGGSGGNSASWTTVGVFGGGGRGQSSVASPFKGAVNGGDGAVRLIWGVNRTFPNSNTGNV